MGRDLSKAKPDVVRRVFTKPNREECIALARFSVRLCVVSRRVEGSRSSLLRWVYMKSDWAVRSHTTPGEVLSHPAGGWSSRVCVRVCVCGSGGWGGCGGWEWRGCDCSDSRGRYCVSRLTVRTQASSIISGLSLSPACITAHQTGTGIENDATAWLRWLALCPLKLVCSNLASELHWYFQFAYKRTERN